MAFAEVEGQAIARWGGLKITLYAEGQHNVPLGMKGPVEDVFKRAQLQVSWAASSHEVGADTNILVTVGHAHVDVGLLTKIPRCMLVAVAFTGYDHVDIHACQARNISVVNVPHYSTESTAELAVGLVLSALRDLPGCMKIVSTGGWSAPMQDDLASKVVGIVGTGSLGVRCAELFSAFKVKDILGYALSMTPQFTSAGGTYVESLAALFLEADIVVLCLPLTPATKGIISTRILELLRPTSLLVNVGRGSVVDEEALVRFLAERRFRAALDVYSEDPLPPNHPIRQLPPDTLFATPHVGYQSEASLKRRFEVTTKNILAFLAGSPINIVV